MICRIRSVVFRAFAAAGLLAGAMFAGAMAADAAPKKSDGLSPWLPPDMPVVVVFRPSQIAAQKHLTPAVDVFAETFEQGVGVPFKELDTLTIVTNPSGWFGVRDSTEREVENLGPSGLIFHSAKPLKLSERLKPQAGEGTPVELGGRQYVVYKFKSADWFSPDDKTVIMGGRRFIASAMKTQGAANSPLSASAAWSTVSTGQVAATVDVAFLRQLLPPWEQLPVPSALVGSVAPLITDVNRITLGMKLGEKSSLIAFAETTEAGGARVQATIQALLTLAKNSSDFSADKMLDPASASFAKLVSQLTNSATIDVPAPATVRLRASAALEPKLVAAVMQSIGQARYAGRQAQSANNLKQIAIAMHNHHDVFKGMPGSAVAKKGHPVSWRVRILPYIEQGQLYSQYRMDEPWDSETNKKVLATMPAVYRHPYDDAKSTNTSYFMVTGKDAFPTDKDFSFAAIKDGTSNTILIVEAKRSVPWTKPEDIEFEAGKPRPQFGGWEDRGFTVAFADGSVQMIQKNVDDQTLRAYFTIAGGEFVNPGVPDVRRVGPETTTTIERVETAPAKPVAPPKP